MAGVNKVIIIGNLGNEPDMRTMPNGRPVANISVATSEAWKDSNGQKQEATEWHRIVLFDRLAEIAGEYLHKGSKVYVEGKLKTRKWQDQQTGQDRYATDIVCRELQMLDSRQGGQQQQPTGNYGQQAQARNTASYGQPAQQSTQQTWGAPPPPPPAQAFTDDDIPF